MLTKLDQYKQIRMHNITIFAIIVLCASISLIFLFIFQTEHIRVNIQGRFAGIAVGLCCFLITFFCWKRFTIVFRILSIFVLIITALIMFQTVISLFNLLFYRT